MSYRTNAKCLCVSPSSDPLKVDINQRGIYSHEKRVLGVLVLNPFAVGNLKLICHGRMIQGLSETREP